MYKDVRKNKNTRWCEGFLDLGYEYKEWRNIRCFGIQLYVVLFFVITLLYCGKILSNVWMGGCRQASTSITNILS